MTDCVARLEWEAVDLSSGAKDGGLAEILLGDVVIVKHEISKGERMLNTRMAELHAANMMPDDIQNIRDECFQDPSATEVAETWYHKSLQLSEDYYVGYSEHPSTSGYVGFGFGSGIGKIPNSPACKLTFSWDWFNVTSPGVAVKLQESGGLEFEQHDLATGPEITHMVFKTDVSLRIFRMGASIPTKPDWRILVREGSEIFWPSLVDRTLVSNGSVH